MKVIKCRLKATGGVMQPQDVVYPKAIDAGRINADELAKLMVSNCSVSYSQVLAVLSALAEVVGDMVTLGHSVEIDGIGVLEPKVKGRVVYGEDNKPKITGGKATVSFKAAKKLKKSFRMSHSNLQATTCATMSRCQTMRRPTKPLLLLKNKVCFPSRTLLVSRAHHTVMPVVFLRKRLHEGSWSVCVLDTWIYTCNKRSR